MRKIVLNSLIRRRKEQERVSNYIKNCKRNHDNHQSAMAGDFCSFFILQGRGSDPTISVESDPRSFCVTAKINPLLCRGREYLQIKANPVLK
jgi:hypothetical protein